MFQVSSYFPQNNSKAKLVKGKEKYEQVPNENKFNWIIMHKTHVGHKNKPIKKIREPMGTK